MDACPLCAGDVVYVGLTRVECATVGCANHRPAPPSAPRDASATLAGGPDPDDDELELWLSSFVFF